MNLVGGGWVDRNVLIGNEGNTAGAKVTEVLKVFVMKILWADFRTLLLFARERFVLKSSI